MHHIKKNAAKNLNLNIDYFNLFEPSSQLQFLGYCTKILNEIRKKKKGKYGYIRTRRGALLF